MSYIVERNPITNEIYKDNESDNVIVIIEKNRKIFNKLVKKKYNAFWKEKKIKLKIGKFSMNEENFIVISLPYNKNLTYEFIAFYHPLVTIINNNFYYDLKLMSHFIESSNNLIICKKSDSTYNDKYISYINIENENFINKLKISIYNNSFENLDFKKMIYSKIIEDNISKYKNILEKKVKFNNLRYLSIKLLTDINFYKYVSKYLNYNPLEDNLITNKNIISEVCNIRRHEIQKIFN